MSRNGSGIGNRVVKKKNARTSLLRMLLPPIKVLVLERVEVFEEEVHSMGEVRGDCRQERAWLPQNLRIVLDFVSCTSLYELIHHLFCDIHEYKLLRGRYVALGTPKMVACK